MIARHETPLDKNDIWSALAATLPAGAISWRQDGRPMTRDGRHIARFVAYIEANTVRERLDAVVPGEWDLHLDPLPPIATLDEDANQGACNFKARLQVLGVIREDVGTGKDYKQASTDAFKRVAVRFGIGHELYDYEQNWVQMDGDGKYAKPIEDPSVAYARRYGKPRAVAASGANDAGVKSAPAGTGDTRPAPRPEATPETPASQQGASASSLALDEEMCPKCGGKMWDNRLTKRNPRAPDWKCRDRACDGVVWPPKGDEPTRRKKSTTATDEEIPF